jgi:adenosine deaminase
MEYYTVSGRIEEDNGEEVMKRKYEKRPPMLVCPECNKEYYESRSGKQTKVVKLFHLNYDMQGKDWAWFRANNKSAPYIYKISCYWCSYKQKDWYATKLEAIQAWNDESNRRRIV